MATEILKYNIHLFGSKDAPLQAYARVGLFGRDGKLFACLWFHDGLDMEESVGEPLGGEGMHFPLSTLPAILEVLRNERPIYFTEERGRPALCTALEPVGEAEGKAR